MYGGEIDLFLGKFRPFFNINSQRQSFHMVIFRATPKKLHFARRMALLWNENRCVIMVQKASFVKNMHFHLKKLSKNMQLFCIFF